MLSCSEPVFCASLDAWCFVSLHAHLVKYVWRISQTAQVTSDRVVPRHHCGLSYLIWQVGRYGSCPTWLTIITVE